MTQTISGDEKSGYGLDTFRNVDYIKVAIFGFALNVLWTPMGGIIMPLLVLKYVEESQENTWLGVITFLGLVLAMLVQPLAGAMSDHSDFGWGRRRHFILAGSVLAMVFLMLLGLANSFILILLLYCLLQVSSNTAHGPWQGLIPDLIPVNKRGTASAVKGIVETLGAVCGLAAAGYFLSQRFDGDDGIKLFLTLGIITIVIAGAMLATVLSIREKPGNCRSSVSFLLILRNAFKIDVKLNTSFVFFLVSRFLFLLPLIVLRTFGLYFLKDVVEVPDPVAAASDLMLAVGISLLIVIYPAGYFSDRFGRRLIVVISGVIGAVGFIVLFFFHNYFFTMLAGAMLGISNGCFMSANWAMATDLVNKGEEARRLGLTNLATAGACAVAAFAGPVIDFFNGYGQNLGYQVVVGACVIFLICSAVMVMKIKTR
jgi:MFS family permease